MPQPTNPSRNAFYEQAVHDAYNTATVRYHAACIAALLTPRWHLAKKLYHVLQQRHFATIADRYGPKP